MDLASSAVAEVGCSGVEEILNTITILLNSLCILLGEDLLKSVGNILTASFLEYRCDILVQELEFRDSLTNVDGVEVVCQVINLLVPDTPDPWLF